MACRAELFERVMAIIVDSPDLTLKNVATILNVHRHSASAAVHEITGMPFRQWLQRHRVQTAKDILTAEPETPVGVVARRVGFGSSQTFARAFRKCCAVTPGDWRKSSVRSRG